MRWFEFFGDPGTERVFIVVTREPLSAVPTADELVAFCGLNKDKCPWQAPADVWQQIEKATTAQVKVATTKNFGQAQTEREKVAMTRPRPGQGYAPTVSDSYKRLEQRANARDGFGFGSQIIWSAPPMAAFGFNNAYQKVFRAARARHFDLYFRNSGIKFG